MLLWVDAICIDQNNFKERNHQVHQMSRIYGAADMVIAWLREPDVESELAIRFISNFRSAPDQIRRIHVSNKEKEHVLWNALESFWSRSYWTRVWVVQELAKARLFYFQSGYSRVTLESLSLLTNCLRKVGGLFMGEAAFQKPRRLLRLVTNEEQWNLAQLLWESAELKSSDTRDRIYGMLGLMPKNYMRHIFPDYKMSFETLAYQITRTYISVENDLNIFCHLKQFRSQLLLPSWIVDFGSRPDSLWSGCYFASANRLSNAALQGNSLRVRSIVIGHVKSIIGPVDLPDGQRTELHSPSFPSSDPTPSIFEEMEALCFTTLRQKYPSEDFQSLEKRFWNLVAGPRFFEAANIQIPWTCRQVWNNTIAQRNAFSHSESTKEFKFTLHFSFLLSRLNRRCVFCTSTNNGGLGPSDLRVGDLVCVLYGCRMRMVLRPSGADYSIVGPAYVDGAMGGEYIRAHEVGGPEAPQQVRFSII